jgi:hypothetical protein
MQTTKAIECREKSQTKNSFEIAAVAKIEFAYKIADDLY